MAASVPDTACCRGICGQRGRLERLLRAAAGGTLNPATPASARPRLGGVSFLHRFGSALNHHVHLHACLTNGVFVPAADDAERDAPPARPINQADLAALGVWLVFSQENVPDPFWEKGGQKAKGTGTNGTVVRK